MKSQRNAPCPCGSGKKYKSCCAVVQKSSHPFAAVALVALVGLALFAVVTVFRDAAGVDWTSAPGQVWSEEHQHWHDAPNPDSEPPGPAPPGKVWSAEHGHWHDASSSGGGSAPPPGPPPAGKVWSWEHGHWHDDPASGAVPQPEPVADVPEPAAAEAADDALPPLPPLPELDQVSDTGAEE
jgi:hypothetical protein